MVGTVELLAHDRVQLATLAVHGERHVDGALRAHMSVACRNSSASSFRWEAEDGREFSGPALVYRSS
jgi:hypothetical protein